MGLILDTSVMIAAERRGEPVPEFLASIRFQSGDQDVAITAVALAELVHGIYRAQTSAGRTRRQLFVEDLIKAVPVYPFTTEAALVAGRIHGEQQEKGIVLPFVDLLIAATALIMNYSVLTINLRHFHQIPGLNVRAFADEKII